MLPANLLLSRSRTGKDLFAEESGLSRISLTSVLIRFDRRPCKSILPLGSTCRNLVGKLRLISSFSALKLDFNHDVISIGVARSPAASWPRAGVRSTQ